MYLERPGVREEKQTQVELDRLPELRRLSWNMEETRQLEFAEQSTKDERIVQRRHQKFAEGPLQACV